MTFGEFARVKRLAAGFSLREFCEKAQIDPSNWSKVERDRLPAAYERDKLEMIAKLMGIEAGGADWLLFFDLASLSQKKIPDDVYSDKDVVEALPIFFRTVRGDKPTDEELNKIIEIMKRR